MAKKGQTFQRYSLEFKEKVVKEYLEGQSKNSLSKTYNITVSIWVHKVHVQGSIAPKKEGVWGSRSRGLQGAIRDCKKLLSLLKGGRSREKIAFITKERRHHRLSVLCDVLEIAPSTDYKYRHQLDPDLPMYRLIRYRFEQSKQTYGYR